ncbi:MAG: virulence RhuM family protein [Acidobacteria bacterium]|nr:virulence RhuM family protein [Acidobacteriota bacterium]
MSDEPKSQLLLYQAPDGRTRLEVRMQGETVWLTQAQMAELFQTSQQNVSLHIQNIYEEGELTPEATHKESLSVQPKGQVQPSATVKEFLIVRQEGSRQVSRSVEHYNLDVIISVGYRVKSHRGTQFRIWATQRLREYIVKGFALDDERLKRAGGGTYFEELLARIRDIRSSEKVFWRKVLEIYATSIDYDPGEEASQVFFATVQNKMHWAAHGRTAAEIVHDRADATRQNMGLTSWQGAKPSRGEAVIAKNYLTSEELEALNRIVNAYLEFAELQALNRKPMYMRDWIAKLENFLRLSGREILMHAGKISHEQALRKAELEFEKFRVLQLAQPSQVEKDFEAAVKRLPPIKKPQRTQRTQRKKTP